MTAAAQATAIIAAAGSGARLGAERPKALVPLAGRPLAAWCLDAFAGAATITRMVIASPPGHLDELAELGHPVNAQVVAGGVTRAESVAIALEVVGTDLVAIHDAARPLVTPALVDALVERLADARDAAGVIAAAPILDTVKRADRERPAGALARIAATEDRDLLWAAQTPQVFRVEPLRAAIGAAKDASAATDEAMLLEAAGETVLLHPPPSANPKVTTADDLRLAELMLAEREA
jgi:2-C-methyl-D-erythritol 4-phosphate cytidylyltransferase